MKSRIHPTYKAKCRVANWAEYEQGLVRRGGVTVWLTPEAIAAWKPVVIGRRGGQLKYSDVAIETALALWLIFNLPLRQAEGFLASVGRCRVLSTGGGGVASMPWCMHQRRT